MRTAHVFAPMLGVAGTSAEFGLATTATVILAGSAITMKSLAPSCRVQDRANLPVSGAAHSSLAGEPAVASTGIDRGSPRRRPRV